MPRVSIITPCYNTARFVGEAIESVQKQTYENWEHVIVDDGSTDRSADIIRQYSERCRKLTLIQQPNQGLSAARNAGVRASSSESDYLLFLDADDMLKPKMLAFMIEYLDHHPEVGVASCYPILIDDSGNRLSQGWDPQRYKATTFGLRKVPSSEAETTPLGIFIGTICVHGTVVRRSVYVNTSGFDTNLDQCEDTDLWARIALRSEVHRIREYLVYYRMHDSQMTANREKLNQHRKVMVDKWKGGLPGLTNDQQRRRFETWRHWHGRYVPLTWLHAARSKLTEGNFGKALVLCAGAAFRYLFFAVSTNDDLYYQIQNFVMTDS
jgi:glycosyltransferase involved in cell wall biosynthesis